MFKKIYYSSAISEIFPIHTYSHYFKYFALVRGFKYLKTHTKMESSLYLYFLYLFFYQIQLMVSTYVYLFSLCTYSCTDPDIFPRGPEDNFVCHEGGGILRPIFDNFFHYRPPLDPRMILCIHSLFPFQTGRQKLNFYIHITCNIK